MKLIIISLVIFCITLFGLCEKTSTNKVDEAVILEKKINQKYHLTAIFYGVNMKYGDNDEFSAKIIKYVVISDDVNKSEVRYFPNDSSTEQAANFYFTNIWSPNEEYAVLPMGKFEGFEIVESKNILDNVRKKRFIDKIKVGNVSGGFYWHDFEKWEDDSTIDFRAGLYGDMFAFKYNVTKSELYCYREKCEEFDIGKNIKGDVKPLKKGDIETLKIH